MPISYYGVIFSSNSSIFKDVHAIVFVHPYCPPKFTCHVMHKSVHNKHNKMNNVRADSHSCRFAGIFLDFVWPLFFF